MHPVRASQIKKSLEAIVLPALALLVLGHWPHTHVGYPWWWLAPLAIALRYGMIYGLGSGLVLVLGSFAVGAGNGALGLLSSGDIVGGFIATYLAALYAGHSRNRLTEANARLGYLEQRLESLTRVFYITRLSHSRLEESLITKSNSLRSALEAISAEIGSAPASAGDPLPLAPLRHLLQLLAFYGRVGTTGIFPVHNGRADTAALAALGPAFTLNPADALVADVIEGEQPAYYSVDQILADQTSQYRAVLPLVAADGTVLALVVVLDMPLLAVDEENLLTMAAMIAYVADALRASELGRAVRKAVPACPMNVALDWARLGHLQRRARVSSAWVLLRPQHDARGRVGALLQEVRRGLDQYWLVDDTARASPLLVLLPLAGAGAVDGFLQRIDGLCRERVGEPLAALGWRIERGLIEQGSGAELASVLTRGDADAR